MCEDNQGESKAGKGAPCRSARIVSCCLVVIELGNQKAGRFTEHVSSFSKSKPVLVDSIHVTVLDAALSLGVEENAGAKKSQR